MSRDLPGQTSLLGSGICFLRARRLGRGAWFVGCSCGTPCPHGLRPMGCKICCCCEHGRLRGQCKECGGSSSFCEHQRCSATTATARNVAAAASASTGGSAASARSVAAAASASTGARATTATVECGGSSICEHGRLCTTCMKEYSGSAIHKHRRQRGLYEHRLLHRRQRSWCRIVAAAASFPWRRQRRQELDGDSGRTHKTLLNRRVA